MRSSRELRRFTTKPRTHKEKLEQEVTEKGEIEVFELLSVNSVTSCSNLFAFLRAFVVKNPRTLWRKNYSDGRHSLPTNLRNSLLVEQLNGFESLAFQQLEARAAARADVRDLVGEPHLLNGGRAVAAADNARRVTVGNGLGDGSRAGVEGGHLEDAHRAVPDHRFGGADGLGEEPRCLRSDVQPLIVVGNLSGGNNLFLAVGAERVAAMSVDGQHQLVAADFQ